MALSCVPFVSFRISSFFSKIFNNPKTQKGISALKTIGEKVGGFFTTIREKITKSKGFERFLKFATLLRKVCFFVKVSKI